MNDSSRSQGGLICVGTVLVGLIFLAGLLARSWWAVAIPVAVALAFVLGLIFWVGWTIMTVDLEPEAPEPAPSIPEGEAPPENRAD
ncbi:MAG: hypothetical protein HKP27_06240 [Myxococcales bacterium]|nr:hypothetical protein [Myxococcales bacterium]